MTELRDGMNDTGIRTVVVPSESLRRHWVSKIVQTRGSVIGVEVLTHRQFARLIVHEGHEPVCNYSAWLDELSRAYAAEEPTLAGALGHLEDGYSIVSRIVGELLDAGLTPAHESGLLDAAKGLGGIPGIVGGVAPRVGALVRVAVSVSQASDALGVCSAPTLLRRATKNLREIEQVAKRFGGAAFVGFADAVGNLADFIEAARRYAGAVVMLELPPSVAQPGMPEIGAEFANPFRQRFEAERPVEIGAYDRSPKLSFLQGSDSFDEAQEVASRVHASIENGMRPESIGIVVRHMDGWAHPIAEALREQGVPFSGVDTKRPGGDRFRRHQAIADVLVDVDEVLPTRWVEAMGDCEMGLPSVAFEAVGARNLQEVAERLGEKLRTGAVGGLFWGDTEPILGRSTLSEEESVRLQTRAIITLNLLDGWPSKCPIDGHIEHASRLLSEGLGWTQTSEAITLLSGIERLVPEGHAVSKEAAVRLIVRTFRETDLAPIGGLGGGVAVLSATEARGRTFDSLFVMGLSRGTWPRVVREDPIFPDSARRQLQVMLPDLRERSLGVLEERFLFSQIVNGGKNVCLSSARSGASGATQHLSSLVVELQLHGRLAIEPEPPSPRARSPWREAVQRGVQGAPSGEVIRIAQVHLERVQEYAVDFGSRPPMDAHMGFVGPVGGGLDPRNRGLYITTIEQIARCPWSAFIQRFLGVKGRVNPRGALPSLSSHLVGLAVHDLIEKAVEHSLSDGRPGPPPPLVWPNKPTLAQWAAEASQRALRSTGVGWTGFYRALVPIVLNALDILQELDVNLEGVHGGEVDGVWSPEGGRAVGFRVDRIGRVDDDVILTDFKLGKPPSVHKTDASRRKKVLESVRQGTLLQGMCYARSRPSGIGRYMFLNPDMEMPVREFRFHADDDEISDAMDNILQEVLDVIQTGAFFPRVSEAGRDKKPQACSYCEVREVCPVEDSSARMALMERVATDPSTSVQMARSKLWWRGTKEA